MHRELSFCCKEIFLSVLVMPLSRVLNLDPSSLHFLHPCKEAIPYLRAMRNSHNNNTHYRIFPNPFQHRWIINEKSYFSCQYNLTSSSLPIFSDNCDDPLGSFLSPMAFSSSSDLTGSSSPAQLNWRMGKYKDSALNPCVRMRTWWVLRRGEILCLSFLGSHPKSQSRRKSTRLSP